MGLRRGDLTAVAFSGDYGKPRPAVVIQSDVFDEVESVVVVPLTSELRSIPVLFRQRIDPTDMNGLRLPSDLMVDKMSVITRARLGKKIGRLTDAEMTALTAAVALFLGF